MTALWVILGLLVSGVLGAWVVSFILAFAAWQSRYAGEVRAEREQRAIDPGAAAGDPERARDAATQPASASPPRRGFKSMYRSFRAGISQPEEDPERRTLKGGLWIGIFERLAVTGAIMGNVPELIIAIVAIKGLGRYPELRAPEKRQRTVIIGGPTPPPSASEKFIIGTFASMLWAAVPGVIVRVLALT